MTRKENDMKFFGTSRGSKHAKKGLASEDTIEESNVNTTKKKPKRRRSVLKTVLLSVAVIIVTAVTVFALDLFLDTGVIIAPPDVSPVPRPSRAAAEPSESNPNSPNSPNSPRGFSSDPHYTPGMRPFTFLILGTDDGANTDAIMVATFDTEEGTLDIVHIPRDTMVNVPWSIKRANSIYANMRRQNRDAENPMEATMQATIEKFADILGFEVDFWVLLNLRSLSRLVDAVGGVDFYVPVNMNYRDAYAGLHINFRRGMQHINGRQASELLRFRSFGSGDLGRINVQQQFLTAAVEQILANRNNINVTELARIFLEYVQTDLDDNITELIWMGNQFLRLNSEDVNFMTMPVYNDWVAGASYVSVSLDAWLEMLNDRINPFAEDIAAENLSILTRGPDRRLFITDGNWNFNQSWGANTRGTAQRIDSGGLQTTGGGGGGTNQGTQQPAPPTPTPPSGNGETTPAQPDTPANNNNAASPPTSPGDDNVNGDELDDDPYNQDSHEPDDSYFDDSDGRDAPFDTPDFPDTQEPTDTPPDVQDDLNTEDPPVVTDPAQAETTPDDGAQVNEVSTPVEVTDAGSAYGGESAPTA